VDLADLVHAMKKILSEPLLHFLAIGLALFALYAVVKDRSREPATIVVGEVQIATLREVFERTWRRAPNAQELRGLIEGYVRDEVMYREGVALGLDKDDSLIRRRVRQKVEFLAESVNGVPEASDTALQAYLERHRDRYRADALFTFEQVYLGAGRLTQLDGRMARAPAREVARVFGQRFAAALAELPAGAWQGPIASGYGPHRVRVVERTEAKLPELAEVREQVKRDWLRDELAAAHEKHYAGVRARYEVRIENPRVAGAQ
jgi:hypothetical protein